MFQFVGFHLASTTYIVIVSFVLIIADEPFITDSSNSRLRLVNTTTTIPVYACSCMFIY